MRALARAALSRNVFNAFKGLQDDKRMFGRAALAQKLLQGVDYPGNRPSCRKAHQSQR